jgi:hypothetical protein
MARVREKFARRRRHDRIIEHIAGDPAEQPFVARAQDANLDRGIVRHRASMPREALRRGRAVR